MAARSVNIVKPRVIIIGAGLAGLAAGVKLVENEHYDVTVLEATGRAGGRVHSAWDFGECSVELGATWVHGLSERNPIYEIAAQNDLLKPESESDDPNSIQIPGKWFKYEFSGCFRTENGGLIDREIVDTFYRIYDGISDKYYQQSSEVDSTVSVGTMIDRDVKEKMEKLKLSEEEKMQMFGLLEWIKKTECIDNGCCRMYDVSLKWFGEYEALPGEFYTEMKSGGYHAIVQFLSEKLPRNSIRFNKVVRCVHWKGDGPAMKQKTDKNREAEFTREPITIECEDGEKIIADHVIVTCSLGFLKENVNTFFKPTLPDEKQAVINRLGFGTVDKIFLQFRDPFWDKDFKSLQLVWDAPEPTSSTDSKVGLEPNKSNFALEEDMSTKWFKEISEFERISYHDDILVGWIYGKAAEYMETLDEEEVKQTCVRLLRQFSGKDIPEVHKIVFSRWNSNAYVKGSYSYVAVGAEGPDFDVMGKPLCADDKNGKIPRVLFAGEATSRAFITTTHAAYISGEREACRLISYYQHKKQALV
ncbi:peroxisomal N(1)-acetyl-spermine/spermidine oxidase-like [Glandiceps talaboti]